MPKLNCNYSKSPSTAALIYPTLYCRLLRIPLLRIYQVYKYPTWLVTARPPDNRAEPINHEALRMGKLAHPLHPKTIQLCTYIQLLDHSLDSRITCIPQVDFHALQGATMHKRHAYTPRVHMTTSGGNCGTHPDDPGH